MVIRSLKELDEIRQQQSGLRCFWGIDSVGEFTRMVRVNSEVIVKNGMATYDFTTMYTAFSLDTLVTNTMEAIQEAQ